MSQISEVSGLTPITTGNSGIGLGSSSPDTNLKNLQNNLKDIKDFSENEEYDDEDASYHSDRKCEDDDELIYDTADSDADSDKFNKKLDMTPPKLSISERSRSKLKSSTVRGTERKRKLSSMSTNSSSYRGKLVSFEKRMHDLSSEKIQDLKAKFPFVKGTPAQDKHGFMRCIPCGSDVKYTILSTVKDHVMSNKHIRNVKEHETKVLPLQRRMNAFVSDTVEKKQQHNIGSKKSTDTQERRMKLCYALLTDGIPFKFLESKNPNGLASLLRSDAGVDISYRAIRDMIPDVYTLELQSISADIKKANFYSVIFDATPDRGEAFAVVIRFVNEMYEIHHRCIALTFYERSFDHASLGTSKHQAVM